MKTIPINPTQVILALAESNARLSETLFNLTNQPAQPDQHLAGLVMRLQQELDFATEQAEDKLKKQLEPLEYALMLVQNDKQRLGEENQRLLKAIAEMKHNHDRQIGQWEGTVQGLMKEREALEIERDALKAENKELRRVFAEVQAAPVAA
jgi:predicted  nucleic acid-binding Zn-ribbon protein